jgi:hypothetical protein
VRLSAWYIAPRNGAAVVLLPGAAGHTAALATQPRAWEARVTSFLNTALNPGQAATIEDLGNNG